MASQKTQRKLTAILSTDVAGYSRLMGADEEATRPNGELLSITANKEAH